MNPTKQIFVIRYSLWSLAAAIILFLLWQNFSPLGSQHIEFNLSKNKYISNLNPNTRVTPVICQNKECVQTMYEDPLYFDLLMTRNFDLVKISLYFQGDQEIQIKMGMQTSEGWNYMLKEPTDIYQENNWQIAEYSFPLEAAYVKMRKINFIISAPGVKDLDKKVIIKKMSFDLYR